MQRQLGNADKALGSGGECGARPVVTPYHLGLLNVKSRFAVPRMFEVAQAEAAELLLNGG